MVAFSKVYRYAAVVVPALAGLVFGRPQQDGNSGHSQYIVTLRKGLQETDISSHINWVSDVHKRSISRRDASGLERTYAIGDFHAYTGEFDEETIAQIRTSGSVVSVESDELQLVTTALVEQTNAPWGIASLSRRSLPNENQVGQNYVYDDSAGEGTWAYVFDTGVMTENSEFEGRAIKGVNVWPEEEFKDFFGHGTHCAGTIASRTYGVAKKATIVDVKTVRGMGYGTVAKFLEALEWTVTNITNTPGRAERSVISVSLAFPTSEALNAGIEAAYEAGVLAVVGAGNDGRLSSIKSPASAPSAITVGAVDINKTMPGWSNYGPGVDVFAPGVRVASLWNEEGAESFNDGTSMATPHVSGLVLYLKALEGLGTPAEATARLKQLALKGVVQEIGEGSPNLLAFNGAT